MVAALSQVLEATLAAKGGTSTHVTEAILQILRSSVDSALSAVCSIAWDYYLDTDVPITDETIPLLQTIVRYHYKEI